MSSKRFHLIRSLLHFNSKFANSFSDRFYKIRPIFNAITAQFIKVGDARTQSIDEVMVACKVTLVGPLREHMKTKPYNRRFKLFCEATTGGFIHDILMYQGKSTFSCHPPALSEKEIGFLVSSKTVIVLLKTVKKPTEIAIYADNSFTSISLIEDLRDDYDCRYVGTARVNRRWT